MKQTQNRTRDNERRREEREQMGIRTIASEGIMNKNPADDCDDDDDGDGSERAVY
jgi:hypothetical protein